MVNQLKTIKHVSLKGMTLIEVLIVVVILAILAMVVMPKFTTASDEAKQTALDTDLHTLRQQIELYKAQHINRGPHLDEKNNLDTKNLQARMLSKTDVYGKIDSAGTFGPYLMEWPANGFVTTNPGDITFGTTDVVPNNGLTGWYYNTNTCLISPNTKVGETESINPAGKKTSKVK